MPRRAAVHQFTRDVYVWSFPGCPLHVHLPIPLIERLAAELNQTPNGAESGGLLIGKLEGGVTRIADFQPVPCDSPGSEYVPSTPTTLRRFEEMIGQAGSMAVGYYRIQNRGINHLSDHDLSLINQYFTGHGNVHLVMGPTQEGPSMAGVFFRESGLVSPVSFMEFACNPQTLRPSGASGGRAKTRLRIEEAPPPPPRLPPPAPPPSPRKRRVSRWGMLGMVGVIALAAIGASVMGFRWGQSELTVSGARPAPGTELLETVRQLQQEREKWLAENEAMKAHLKELDSKLSQFTGGKKGGPAVAPAAGKLLWIGYLAESSTVVIEGRRATSGTVSSALPTAPTRISVYPAELSSSGLSVYSAQARHASSNLTEQKSAETGWLPTRYLFNPERAGGIAIVEAPSEANGYKLTLRSGARPVSAALIEWRTAQ